MQISGYLWVSKDCIVWGGIRSTLPITHLKIIRLWNSMRMQVTRRTT